MKKDSIGSKIRITLLIIDIFKQHWRLHTRGKLFIKNKHTGLAALITLFLFSFILAGCSRSISDGDFKVDKKSKQVTVGEDIYKYDINSDYSLTITYPDGVTYVEMSQGGASGYSADIDEKYVKGDVLADEIYNVEKRGSKILVSAVLCLVGVIILLAPYFIWGLSDGWKFKDAKPSKIVLIIIRIFGIIVIGTGIVLLFM